MRKKGAYVEVSSKPKMVRVVSSTKMCARCMIWCDEIKALFPPGGAAIYYRLHGRLPTCKVICRNHCHLRTDWGWVDAASFLKKNKHRHIQLK